MTDTLETTVAEIAAYLEPPFLGTLALIADGYTVKQAATRLKVDERTVGRRLRAIREATNTRTNAHAVAHCVRRGLLPERKAG